MSAHEGEEKKKEKTEIAAKTTTSENTVSSFHYIRRAFKERESIERKTNQSELIQARSAAGRTGAVYSRWMQKKSSARRILYALEGLCTSRTAQRSS